MENNIWLEIVQENTHLAQDPLCKVWAPVTVSAFSPLSFHLSSVGPLCLAQTFDDITSGPSVSLKYIALLFFK